MIGGNLYKKMSYFPWFVSFYRIRHMVRCGLKPSQHECQPAVSDHVDYFRKCAETGFCYLLIAIFCSVWECQCDKFCYKIVAMATSLNYHLQSNTYHMDCENRSSKSWDNSAPSEKVCGDFIQVALKILCHSNVPWEIETTAYCVLFITQKHWIWAVENAALSSRDGQISRDFTKIVNLKYNRK